jgi:hypothetical protein
VSSERLISQFARWYDTDAPNIISGNIERLAFHGNGRTFDAYVRSDARGAVPSRLFQVRSEYRHPQGDIERALAGKRVNVFGWRARETAGTFCAPVCGMFGDYFTVLDASGPTENVTPDGPALKTPLPARNVVGARFNTPNNGFRIVALKRERLEISSRDIEKFVDRDFEPGEEHYLFPGNDWTISTPNGAAFELRVLNTSLGPLADAGAVKAQSVDAIAPSSELYQALTKRDDLLTRYSEKHPEMAKADALVRELLQRRKASLAR